ncbi:MAG: hypothetical protein DRN81_06670 [Thermoproteota archaeon]|nr:MAG: hypothetical protein DRN81_06670 [Candidatus Korarchaeota archaeon]
MVESWCELKIDFMFVKGNSGCVLCDGGSGKVDPTYVYEKHTRLFSRHHGEVLTQVLDEYGNIYIRSPPIPLKNRRDENHDNCRSLLIDLIDYLDIPIIYHQYIPIDDETVFDKIRMNARYVSFDIIHRGDVFIDYVDVSGRGYLRLTVLVNNLSYIDRILETFYKILPERWFE